MRWRRTCNRRGLFARLERKGVGNQEPTLGGHRSVAASNLSLKDGSLKINDLQDSLNLGECFNHKTPVVNSASGNLTDTLDEIYELRHFICTMLTS